MKLFTLDISDNLPITIKGNYFGSFRIICLSSQNTI